MSEPQLLQQQRTMLRELCRLLEERRASAVDSEADFQARNAAIDQERQQTLDTIATRVAAEQAAADRELTDGRQAVLTRFEANQASTKQEYRSARDGITDRFDADTEAADKKREEKRYTRNALAEAKRKEVEAPFQEVERKVTEGLLRVKALRQEAGDLVRRWRHGGGFVEFRPAPSPPGPPLEALRDLKKALLAAEDRLTQLKALGLARFFEGKRPLIFLLILLLLGNGAFFFVHGLIDLPQHWALLGTGAAVLLDLSLCGLVYALGRVQIMRVIRPLRRRLADVESAAERAREVANNTYQTRMAELARDDKERAEELKKIEAKYTSHCAALVQRRDEELRQAGEKYPKVLAVQQEQRDAALQQLEERKRRRLAELQQKATASTRHVEEKHRTQREESQKRHEQGWHALVRGWQQGVAQVQATVAEIDRVCRRLGPAWDDPAWAKWQPPQRTPPVLRFGRFPVAADTLVAGPPDDRWRLPEFALPALLAFPQRASMLLRARDAGRAVGVQSLQAMMLRFLTALPPGKVRFTIVDPVGLGENFAAFMHLADHDEALVGSRIWTEPAHIEQRLTDLSAHMETVIQKYLRNQYASIEEYNTAAGEVAEPFRVLVVANFPVNFNTETARRLVSIASSGASCGVYVLVLADTRQSMPEGFRLADLEQACVTLSWQEPRFVWKDDDFTRFPLQLDIPPAADVVQRLLHQVGSSAKDASRVQVPFDFIAPTPEQYFTGDSRSGINVALGRAGATKRQYLQLGHGTSQHVLIAGKTGSGKSTLLHALITNLALLYGPDEVELYLIDFKKGVEFKTYANLELPHARVIAIESEREFGLSVLQRLDAELRERGERFRTNGVNDLAGYRQATGQRCPRLMFIVDEFQEFFVEDDKVSQEAALLLDRLVRQGRAFGLHVLLGSQTLGGAYTLARSTIDQMAVRIALQCSEADANLILSKDNSAARLLSRPGEAIYNDQNGLLEGNDLFQVVWLPEERREELLTKVRDMARQRRFVPPRPQLVFEGNAPADVHKNPLLTQALRAAEWPAAVPVASAWLGEAIAIKEPTAAVFRRQSGSHLLLLGQHGEGALGILALSLVGLAAQQGSARFLVLDGSPADAPHVGTLGQVAAVLPQSAQAGGWRDVAALMTEAASEVDRRQKAPDAEYPSVYLVIFGLHRFRELRKAEDDFGFGRGDDKAASPSKQLEIILKEGAGVGVHALVWCDSLTNLQRSCDRQMLREFALRVLFQMSPTDSSTLIDTPAASKLGLHRALFHDEDLAVPEKFRPYALPDEAWLAEVKAVLAKKRQPAPAGATG